MMKHTIPQAANQMVDFTCKLIKTVLKLKGKCIWIAVESLGNHARACYSLT